MAEGRRSVLIVEDDPDLRRMYRTALTLAGFAVREAADGTHALHQIDGARPDVIVLDLMLPTLDGIAVRQEIAAHAHTRDIPIIIITGSTMSVEHLAVSCVLRKPVSPDEFIKAVHECLMSGGAPGAGV